MAGGSGCERVRRRPPLSAGPRGVPTNTSDPARRTTPQTNRAQDARLGTRITIGAPVPPGSCTHLSIHPPFFRSRACSSCLHVQASRPEQEATRHIHSSSIQGASSDRRCRQPSPPFPPPPRGGANPNPQLSSNSRPPFAPPPPTRLLVPPSSSFASARQVFCAHRNPPSLSSSPRWPTRLPLPGLSHGDAQRPAYRSMDAPTPAAPGSDILAFLNSRVSRHPTACGGGDEHEGFSSTRRAGQGTTAHGAPPPPAGAGQRETDKTRPAHRTPPRTRTALRARPKASTDLSAAKPASFTAAAPTATPPKPDEKPERDTEPLASLADLDCHVDKRQRSGAGRISAPEGVARADVPNHTAAVSSRIA